MRLALVYEHSFKHSRFLCCSIPSFGVSATSPSSFNMSQPSAIIFIKCRNPHHMKNNIRYKGNINNTSVIIFLIEGQKLPVMLLCLGEPPVRFCDVGCICSFIFVLHFVVVVFHSFPGYFTMSLALHPGFSGP